MKKIATTEISPWKIDNFFERFLARLADKSSFAKKLYVNFYKIFDAKYYKKGLKFINNNINLFSGDLSEKERNELIVDIVYSLHRFGCMFDEYFLYNFHSLNTEGRDSFITDKIRWSFYSQMNSRSSIELFNDKKRCYDLLGKYFKRDLILVSSKDDETQFAEFVKKHNRFIVKPYDSSGGRGIHIQTVENDNVDMCFQELIANGKAVVCEELIIQSEEMSCLHPSSVNTLRVPTIKDKDGVHLFHPLLRVGVGNAVIDNASSGGIFALVNPETGIVYTEAKDEKGGSFLTHPDTNIVFPGFKVPDWEQAVELVKSVACEIEDCRYVGWDLAHTKNGWVVVEGNPRGQLIMMQLFFKNGFKPEFEQYIKNR